MGNKKYYFLTYYNIIYISSKQQKIELFENALNLAVYQNRNKIYKSL
jgi:hypothetical protein